MSRKKKPRVEFRLMFAVVTDYSATVEAAINPEVLDKRNRTSGDTKVFNYGTRISIEAHSIYEDEEAENNNMYYINIHSSIRSEEQYISKLDDYHAVDGDRQKIYRRQGGILRPVYNIPQSIGHMHKVRGSKDWSVWIQLPQMTISDMLLVLQRPQPSYIEFNRMKDGQSYDLRWFSLRTCDPAVC
jgi:hypothetical protein